MFLKCNFVYFLNESLQRQEQCFCVQTYDIKVRWVKFIKIVCMNVILLKVQHTSLWN